MYEDKENFSTEPCVFCHLLGITHALDKQSHTVCKHRIKSFLSEYEAMFPRSV